MSGLCKVTVTRLNALDNPRLTKAELVSYEKAVSASQRASVIHVDQSEAGLVFFDGELVETLKPSLRLLAVWPDGDVKGVDLRPLPLEVTAQEMTKDKISLRVTLTSDQSSRNPGLHGTSTRVRSRCTIGGRTLEVLLG